MGERLALRRVPDMRTVICARDHDESLIAINAWIGGAVVARRWRAPPVVRRCCVPDPGDAVPRCADYALGARIEPGDADPALRTFEHGDRDSEGNVGDDDHTIGTTADNTPRARIELDPGNVAVMILELEYLGPALRVPYTFAAILARCGDERPIARVCDVSDLGPR